jgi:acyl transferase domain-containing protein/aryl carrier-like protein
MQANEQAAAIDIAIVGMACRFPGAADYDEYWQNLISRRNCIREVPSDRWSWQQYFGDPKVEPNKTSVKWGGFIDDVDKFDPLFFGIAPNEAAFIDPQHRLFLEAAWHAVEDAGYSVGSLSGRAIGVYAGVSKNDYSESMRESRYEIAPYISTGTVHSILTNRVSFLLNLHGRSEAVDTACSSSLVALHNAIRDIMSGECEAAIVGGVNALITPTMFISHSKSGMLSPDGQCKTFSASANGYVRSEGVGVLFIKPLEHAVRDGDHVHAVIKSSAINHGGRSNFLTSPTTEAQAAVVTKALRRGNIDPRTIDYIETHGTGTPLGDPIEINGLKKAFAQLSDGSTGEPYCALSAVKTNVGHLESASGMAGIIKVVLAMKHRQIPGIRNFDRLNPYIELDDSPFFIATEAVPWEPKDQPRRAGVSSFGMGGVNAHVVLEEAPSRTAEVSDEGGEHVFVLSAKKGRLKAYAESLARYVARSNDSLRDIAFTLQNGRDSFDERLTVLASSAQELIAGLESYVRGESTGAAPASAMAQTGKRIPLPTYPFARKRCWYTDVPSRMPAVAQPEPVAAAPSARRLSAADFFIRDHVVQGKPMLPGVAHLEFARAAGSAQQQVRVLKDVFWMTPVVVDGDAVTVDVRLTPQNDRLNFELLQNDIVHSKGSLLSAAVPAPAALDLRTIESRCTAGTSKAELYALLQEHGLAYGSSFQAIERYAHNDREIFAELRLPAEAQGGFVLHPSIMDGVFQAITALSIAGLKQTARQFVPFYLEAAEIVNPTGTHCFVHATANPIGGELLSFNATLCDAEGKVLVNIRNLQKRPIGERRESMPRDVYYRPVWRKKDVNVGSAAGTLLVIADDDSAVASFRAEGTIVVRRGAVDFEALLQELKDKGQAPSHVAWLCGLNVQNDSDVRGAMDATIYGILELTQAAFKAKLRDVTLLHVHPLGASVHSMVAGFARTLKYENPRFDYVTVGIDEPTGENVARAVYAELAAATRATALREVAYRGGERYERTIVRDTVPSEALAPVLKRGGVYLISGGAGGLGSVFSRHLATKYEATILWLGRSAMTPAIAARAAEIGKCEYFSVDITDREALARVFAQIKATYGEIHGVIHGAGLIEDAFILRKQRDSFARVVEPKILGALNLDALTQDEPLDFFVVFSSIAALMPNQGQCDYAAANSFLDSFVEARNRGQRPGVSLALNWPLWANGGMRVAPEEERHLLKVFGMKPLGTADGIALFETALSLAKSSGIHQFIAIGGDQEKIERSLGVEASAPVEAPKKSLQGELKSIFAARLSVSPETLAGDRTLGELGVSSLTLVGVIQDINKRFDAGLKPTLLFDINTIDKLAAHLVAIGKDQIAGPARWNRSLIDVDRSDPARRTFSRTFRTAEFYLRDHVVDGQYNMPGACYVEMARQAGDLLLGDKAAWKLQHNYWASPLSSPQEDFTAHVQITPKQDHLAYEVVSYTASGERHLHAMGQIARQETPAQAEARIDVAAVQSRCDEIQDPEKIYQQIHGEGLIVGPSFQPMTQIFLNDAEALGMLVLPEEVRGTVDDYVLNPALLTGAFQTALISNRRVAGNNRHYIPIGMDELEVLAPIPAECCIYSRPRPGNARNEEMRKFDVEICRTDGTVVVKLKGFSIRALRETAAVAAYKVSAETANAGSGAVQELIKTKLAGPIGLAIDEIDPAVPFDQYGVTSIMVVELNQAFEEIFGPIPKTLFFEYRNVAELAEYFAENHADVLARLPKETPAVAAAETSAPTDVRDEARTFLRALIARPIGLAAEEIDVHAGFDQYGVNSVMVVELNENFENIFGPLSKTLFFEYRSVDELAGYFLDEHREKLLGALPRKPVAADLPERVNRPEVVGVVVDDRSDIAIVSAAGRFPGARNLREFWDLLKEGRDCITEIPADRFNYRKYYDPDPERNGIYAKWGGFIDDVDRFDPAFFNISPREAELIDPQERLLLEVVWEMFEHAGYTRQRLHRLSDRKVGVFVGALWQPYESAGIEATLSGNVVGPSSLLYSVANRISYYFDLSGPSMAIDTACSSSLTALHLACQSIRDGESQFAIAAGVNLSLAASKYLFLSRGRFLSTDGRCRSYGAGGDGYVPGEGVCALLLKPLSKAIADGDSIMGVIKGSAINHGGRTNGYTVPNPKSQGNVIAEALQRSHVDPRAITYIDGHGTGTSLGDPVEIAGLEKALGLSKDSDRVAIGSVKSNIGHLEAAAGIASIIKVLLQMQHGQLAPSLHSEVLNPNIDFNRSMFRVQRELAPWPRREEAKRCAGVSSFGAGGSNAHVILEEYDGPAAPALRSTSPALFVFSARNEERLLEVVRRFDDSLRGADAEQLHEIAYTLQLGREALRERFAVVAGSIEALRAALAAFLEKRQNESCRRGRAPKMPRQAPERWWQDKGLLQLAEGWVEGLEIDWAQLYGGRNYRFLPLPTYPFAKERYWLDAAVVETSLPVAPVAHPLLHSKTSGQSYSSTFNGEEFFFADHMVRLDGKTFEKVLPGVASLEMARAAIQRTFPARSEPAVLELRNMVWAQPIVFRGNAQFHVALSASGDDRVDYRVYSEDNGREIVHCQGRGAWSAQSEPVRLDLERLRRQMTATTVDAKTVYEAFVRTGGIYGPAFQGVTAIHHGSDQLLAYLRLPKVIENTLSDFVLHPTLMDSALQCYLGLIDDWFAGSGQTRMPFALESARVYAPCTAEMVAWMRYSPGSKVSDPVVRLDIDLCDPQGRVCVRMLGFAVRAVPGAAKQVANDGLLTLAPVWKATQVEAREQAPRAGERVVVVGGEEAQHDALRQVYGAAEVLKLDARATVEDIAAKLRGGAKIDHVVWILPSAKSHGESEAFIAGQEDGVLLGFRLIKALLSEKYGMGRLAWTVITNQTVRVGGEQNDAAHGSVDGLVGSMAKEYRNWDVRLVDVEGDVWPWREMLRLPFDERGDGWAHRNAQWYRRQLVELANDVRDGGYERQGVYVVVGGAGGVGEVLSQYLINRYDARIVWLGRRPLDEEIAKKQERAAAAGGERPLYIAADARKREDLERACDEIRQRYGRINGVIQSAIVLSDKGLAGMTEEQFRAALSAKVDTAVRVEQVFGREPLDFILYFSSLESFLKAPGQSNYAAGCTFTDAFAEWQSANAAYPVKVMNWGYWGSVGVAATPEHRAAMARIGWGSVEPEEGMAALERLLTGPARQLGLLRTVSAEASRSMAMATAMVPEKKIARSTPPMPPDSGLLEQVEASIVDAVVLLLKVRKDDVDLDAELSEFGFDSISLTSFANHVNQAYALELMPTIFFEHPTVRRFAKYLVANHAAKFGAPKRVETPGLLERTEQWLADAVCALLKVRRDDVDVDAELSEFGFDSITLTGFANHVNQAFALELMPTIFFEHPTVRAFAKYLADRHGERLTEKFGLAETVAAAKPVVKAAAPVQTVQVRENANEPIAVIGMSGRFPEAEDLDAFWENLKAGRDSIREVPADRWDWRALKIKEQEDGSDSGAKWGAFMEGVDLFDPLFFGISPREAERIDPQHRLTMMFGWKAFEDAGYGPKQLSGSRTGVFIGTTSTGYGDQLLMPDGSGIEGYTATGLVPSVGPNRLSYLLNLHGPSEPIETACSSSLVAVHRAVRSIESGECEMALAGGVNTLFPNLHVSFTKAGMLSPDGRCKTFSGRANGYGRGEGVGMVVLKKLSAAERDGDQIYGLIRGSSENHGGRAQSLTAPNPNAQADLIKDAFRRAGVSPASVGYIEAHGTGTPLGDPIEINGLKSAFEGLFQETAGKPGTGYCGLGSVKTNIGHLELAAGIAGLIKILLQMKHRTLVPSIHCDEINPYIRLEDSPFFIVRENRPWTRLQDGNGGEWPLRAGVSSFGFGGVNSHVVVEEYAGRTAESRAATSPVLVVLSAKTPERLKEQAAQLRQWIARHELSDGELAGVAYTLQVGREAMDHRVALTVRSMQELNAKLGDFVDGKSGVEGLHRGEVKNNNETLALFRGDEELREAVGKWIERGKWAKLLDLWVKGLEIEWEQLYGAGRPRRVSLPTYPFANVRCWVDTTASRNVAATASAAVLHPLLHRNTSDFGAQRYSSTFTGEEFFLADHQVRNGHGAQKILPGVAYLEMARAAVRQASTNHESSILELRDTVWLKPVVVTEPQEVSITLSAVDDDSIDYEIHSDSETVHCQGQAVYVRPPAVTRLDLEQLRRQMSRGRLDAAALYDMCGRMGLHYGPAHRGVTSIQLGDQQLLAELRLPAGVDASDYVLHPSVMDSALQASLALFIDLDDVPGKPAVPFGIESLRIVSASTTQMIAWARNAKKRSAEDKAIKVDIDLCDAQGNVCVQIRGLASRILDAGVKPASQHRIPIRSAEDASSFDDSFYQSLIADIASHKVSVDEAAELE